MNDDHKTPERRPPDIPFIVYESERARADRDKARMEILCGVTIAALVLTNAAWILHCLTGAGGRDHPAGERIPR